MLTEPPTTGADLRWSMLGLRVRVSPWFWLVCLLMGSSLPGLNLVLVWVGVCFVCILVHELGHALTARAFGERGVRIVLYGFGGLAISPGNACRGWARMLMIFMGPGAGFLLLGVLWTVTGQAPNDWGQGLQGFAVHQAMWICLWWGLINLLPVFPLDGGQLLHEGLRLRWPDRAGDWARVVSVVTGFATAGAWAWWHFDHGGGFDLGLYPVVLFVCLAIFNLQELKHRASRRADCEEPREEWQRDPDWWKHRD